MILWITEECSYSVCAKLGLKIQGVIVITTTIIRE